MANADGDTVSKVVGDKEVARIDVGESPRGVVAAFGSIWVSVAVANQVGRIDPKRAKVVQRIQVGQGPEGITAVPKSVWVANGIDGTLTRIAPPAD